MKFKDIKEIPVAICEALERINIEEMREIQELTILPLLQGRDVLAQSQTGSGKTLGFGIPAIIKSLNSLFPTSLIITPTRELAEQIAKELKIAASSLANFKIVTLYGGVPLRAQADSLSRGANIIIGTPGRIIDHLSKETLTLDSIRTVVLDEADKMLNMGFYDDIIKIVRNGKNIEQRALFSATFPNDVKRLVDEFLQNPLILKVNSSEEKSKIDEIVYRVDKKFRALNDILQSYKPTSVLIFCNTKQEVINLADDLYDFGHSVIDLHGDLEQYQRDESIICFSNDSKKILVATDVASRGIDIKDIAMVINYDLPRNQETYTHRIGRTGRSGASGIAISLFEKRDINKCSYVLERAKEQNLERLKVDKNSKLLSSFETLCINGGKRQKLRAGDILGTLCKELNIDPKDIGKISITNTRSYIAIEKSAIRAVPKNIKAKKKKYTTWIL